MTSSVPGGYALLAASSIPSVFLSRDLREIADRDLLVDEVAGFRAGLEGGLHRAQCRRLAAHADEEHVLAERDEDLVVVADDVAQAAIVRHRDPVNADAVDLGDVELDLARVLGRQVAEEPPQRRFDLGAVDHPTADEDRRENRRNWGTWNSRPTSSRPDFSDGAMAAATSFASAFKASAFSTRLSRAWSMSGSSVFFRGSGIDT